MLRALAFNLLLNHLAPNHLASNHLAPNHLAPQEAPGTALWSSLGTPGVMAPSGSVAERRVKAREYFADKQYQNAAREFEALAREGRAEATNDLFNAASARVALGQHAQAAAYLEVVLNDASLGPDQQAEARALQASTLAKLRSVTVVIQTPTRDATTITLRAEFVPRYMADQRPPIERSAAQGGARQALTFDLDPGTWQISSLDPRFETRMQQVEVSEDSTITWKLQARQDPARWRRFAASFAGASGAVALTGVGLLAGGQVRWSSTLAERDDCGVTAPSKLEGCRRVLGQAASLRVAGGALLGVGLGGIVTGLTTLTRAPRPRRALWLTELALGAGSVIGGAIVARRGRDQFQAVNASTDLASELDWNDAGYRDRSRQGARRSLIGASWAGLGGGLILGAVTGLLVERAGRFNARAPRVPRNLRAQVGPGHALLVMSGTF